jgi:hypothetical protein
MPITLPHENINLVLVNDPVTGSPDGVTVMGTVNIPLTQLLNNIKTLRSNIIQNSFDKIENPTSSQDSDEGYTFGSLWLNTTTLHLWVCIDPTSTNAVWIDIYSQENVVPISNFNGIQDPTNQDDVNNGYSFGSFWYNQNTEAVFICVTPVSQNAVWVDITNPGSVSGTQQILSKWDAGRNPIITDDESIGYTKGSFWYNYLTNNIYVCTDSIIGGAEWINVTEPNVIIDDVFEKNPSFNTIRQAPTTTNFTESFVFGSSSMDDTGQFGHKTRIIFDKEKSCFRAGRADNLEWDKDYRGEYSFALNRSTEANKKNSGAIGYFSKTNFNSSFCHASGKISQAGDAQYERVIAYGTTTDNSWKDLKIGNYDNITIETPMSCFYDISILGKRDINDECWAYTLKGLFIYNGIDEIIVKNSDEQAVYNADNTLFDVRVNVSSNIFQIQVKGDTGHQVNWVAKADFIILK